MKVGELISAYLSEHNISLREFSRRADMSPAGVSYYISGKIVDGDRVFPVPDTATLSKIAKAMNLTANELLSCISTNEAAPAPQLSAAEQEALALIRSLPEDKVKAVLALLRTMS